MENWRGKSILHYTDNAAAARILSYGSRNPEIQRMVFEITLKCRNLGISISADWMSREEEEMKLADLGSRGPWFPMEEFQLDFDTMEMILSNYNFASPTDSVRVAQVIKGLKRKFAKPVIKKRPITPVMAKSLLSLYTSKGLESMDLMELRSAAFFSVLYFCCARYEEAAKLKMENVKVTVEGNLEFLFMEAKNNQLLECRKSYVSPTVNGGDLCPVKIIAEYSKKMKESGGQGFFFSFLYPTRLPIPGSTFSYDNARKLTIDALRHVGLEESELKHYGLHSPDWSGH